MGNSASTIRDNAVVCDTLGRRYVVVHPGYARSAKAARCALVGRVVVCVLSAVALVLNVAGEVAPMYSCLTMDYVTDHYSMWQTWSGTATNRFYVREQISIAAPFALTTAGFNLIGLILSALLLSNLSKDAEAQREDKANSEVALAKYGHLRREFGDDDAVDSSFPYTNLRVINCGQVSNVPYEIREEARRQYDKNLCAAALSMHIMACIFALATILLMNSEYGYQNGGMYMYWGGQMGAGIFLFAVLTGLLGITFILNSIPQLLGVMLCGSLKPERCVLMVVDDDAAAAVATEQLGYAVGRGQEGGMDMVHGVRVALPGPATQAEAAASYPTAAEADCGGRPSLSSSPQHGGGFRAEVEVPYAYSTANYYAPPPQLFSLSREEERAREGDHAEAGDEPCKVAGSWKVE